MSTNLKIAVICSVLCLSACSERYYAVAHHYPRATQQRVTTTSGDIRHHHPRALAQVSKVAKADRRYVAESRRAQRVTVTTSSRRRLG